MCPVLLFFICSFLLVPRGTLYFVWVVAVESSASLSSALGVVGAAPLGLEGGAALLKKLAELHLVLLCGEFIDPIVHALHVSSQFL